MEQKICAIKCLKTLLICALFIFCLPTSAAKNTIIWQSVHVPPSSIKAGPYKGQGFVQLILQQITERLPEYEHQFPVTTLTRTTKDMRAGRNVCPPSLLPTKKRKEWAVFSHASLFNQNNHLIMSTRITQQLKEKSLTLADLKQHTALSYSIIKKRAYGNAIDKFLEGSVPDERRLNITSDNLDNIIRLVALNKVDVTFAFPFKYQYFMENNPDHKDKVVIRTIAEKPNYIVGSVACSNTLWGKRVIRRVNEALALLKPTQSYKDAMTRWWPKDSLDKEFEDFYQDQFLRY